MQTTNIFLDLVRNLAVAGANDPSAAQFKFVQGDTLLLALNGQVPVTDGTSLNKYTPAHIDYNTLQAAILLIDAAPVSGTFKVTAGANTTPALAFNIAKADFAAALNALASVTAAGGVTAITSGPANIFGVIWNTPGSAITLTAASGDNKLAPFSFIAINADGDIPGKVEIKLHQAPVAYTNQFSLPTPPPPVMSRVRAGSATANEIQRLTIPDGAAGGFSFVQSGNAGEIVQVDDTAILADITSALNDPWTAVSATDVRYSVTNPAAGTFDIEFIGTFAKTAMTLLTVDLYDQTPIDTPTAKLALTSVAIEDLLNGAQSVPAIFCIVADNTLGEQTTLCLQACTILADGLDPQTSSTIQEIATRTVTVDVFPDGTAASMSQIARLGQSYTNPLPSNNFTFNHNFGTTQVGVIVLVNTGTDTWDILQDIAFQVHILDANNVQLVFQDTIPEQPAVGSIKVYIYTLQGVNVIGSVEVTTDQVQGVGPDTGSTLTQIITALRATLPSGWPNIPANKITGTLNASQIDLASLSAALATSPNFLSTLTTLISNSNIVEALAAALATSPNFLTTLTTLASNSTYLSALVTNLQTNPVFAAALNALVTTALQTGGVLPNGAVMISITDVSEVFPPMRLAGSKLANAYGYLFPSVGSLTDGGNFSGALPTGAKGDQKEIIAPGATALPVNGRRALSFPAGATVVNNGLQWFRAFIASARAYALDFEQELFTLYVNENMLCDSTQFACAFTVQIQMLGNCEGRYLLVMEIGAASGPDLAAITWSGTQIMAVPVIVNDSLTFHTFGYSVARDGSGTLTAQQTLYSKTSTTAVIPGSANFAIRAKLTQFDCEDVADPRGQITIAMKGAKASVVPAS